MYIHTQPLPLYIYILIYLIYILPLGPLQLCGPVQVSLSLCLTLSMYMYICTYMKIVYFPSGRCPCAALFRVVPLFVYIYMYVCVYIYKYEFKLYSVPRADARASLVFFLSVCICTYICIRVCMYNIFIWCTAPRAAVITRPCPCAEQTHTWQTHTWWSLTTTHTMNKSWCVCMYHVAYTQVISYHVTWSSDMTSSRHMTWERDVMCVIPCVSSVFSHQVDIWHDVTWSSDITWSRHMTWRHMSHQVGGLSFAMNMPMNNEHANEHCNEHWTCQSDGYITPCEVIYVFT